MKRLSGKQILIIIGQKNYDEQELEYLNDIFIREGAMVNIASQKPEKALGRLEGYTVPHLTFAEARPQDYDAMVLIGGYGAYTSLWDNTEVYELIKKAHRMNKVIAGASVSTVTLANAGILRGKKATAYPDYNAAVRFQEEGADYIYQSVVADNNIITSNHPRQVKEFAETIISKLTG